MMHGTLLPIPCAFQGKLHACISTDPGLVELADCMQRHPWLDEAGESSAQALGKWMGDLGYNHSNLCKVVGAVVAVMKADSEETKLQPLQPGGTMMAVWESCWHSLLRMRSSTACVRR